MLHDAFICHAHEDKAGFVRDLASRLRDERVDVWYDEFSLTVGSSLRRSIDRGLSQSRFGIVVLSPRFFEKQWSQWELDGLVARQNSGEADLLLPVWHEVTRGEVLAFSPSLADRMAAQSASGVEEVVRLLTAVIKPQGSALVVARQVLLDWGAQPPVISDDWWLDVAAAAESNPMEGHFQEPMGWGRWGFPLPLRAADAEGRGSRLAWAAMQMTWQADANSRPITQVTHPDELHGFLEQHPGLLETCLSEPRFAITYAPQLTIRGFGGPLEEQIEALYRSSLERCERARAEGSRFGSALTIDQRSPGCDEEYVLRDPEFGSYRAANIACGFVQGNYIANGPPVRYFCHVEYLAWLLSDGSGWLPSEVRAVLLDGMGDWCVWTWGRQDREGIEFGFEPASFTGEFQRFLYESDASRPRGDALLDIEHRLDFSSRLLGLPENGRELTSRLLEGTTLDQARADSLRIRTEPGLQGGRLS